MGTVSLTFPISVFQFSQSSFTDTPCSTMMMIKVVLAVAALLAVAEARSRRVQCPWSESNDESICDAEYGCSYGCDDGYCWSQCNALDSPTHGSEYCTGENAWCWLEDDNGDDAECDRNRDCTSVRRNSCSGSCW